MRYRKNSYKSEIHINVKTQAEMSEASTSQGRPRNASRYQQPAERQGSISLWGFQREQGPVDTFISEFWPLEL